MVSTLTIHFTRDENKSNDDTVKIIRGDNEYTLNVIMYDAITQKKYTTPIPKKSLHTYVNSLLTLSKYDSDPFKQIQISAPYYPCFLFSPNDMVNVNIRSSINSLLKISLHAWFPYDEDEEDEDEDEDEDEEDDFPRDNCHCNYC